VFKPIKNCNNYKWNKKTINLLIYLYKELNINKQSNPLYKKESLNVSN